MKPLGEEEIYINKSNNKQKVINNRNIKSKDEIKSISRILVEFSKNIKKVSKVEAKKFKEWRKEFDEDFIIAAIKQSVKYNIKHIGYIEGIKVNIKIIVNIKNNYRLTAIHHILLFYTVCLLC